ncbi:MAG: YfiR family protein [Thermodesulfobacteriota bacterium]|nr:YfiR family protein [Thermodesulfobacteriota bacterium]
MRQRKPFALVVCLCLILAFCENDSLFAQDIDEAPPKLQAALFVKLLAFNKGLASGGDISIYVVGSQAFATAMKSGIGQRIGQGKISAVTTGDGLPTEKPEVIYVGNASMTDKVIEYTRANGIMSITGKPAQVKKGVALGVGVREGKPKILLNLSASKAEGIDWNPALLKIATVFR